MWTTKQRVGIVVVLAMVLIGLSLFAWMNPVYLSDRREDAPRAGEVKDRLDPNTASAEDLSILPELGEARAREIVAFRTRELQRHPGAVVFERAEDLSRVREIGVTTARGLGPYLIFPTTRP